MKPGTIWAAVLITAATCFGLGVALGSRPDFYGFMISEFFNKWQSLIGAITAIITTGATLQAGWWALSGPREQIKAAEEEQEKRDEKRYKAIRARSLLDLNQISHFSTNAIEYICSESNADIQPKISEDVIENLLALIEANRPESSNQALSLINKIQLVQAWISDIKLKMIKIPSTIPIATLHCLTLYAKCMKWYDYARNETELIDDLVEERDIRSAIRIIAIGKRDVFRDPDFDMERLNHEIKMEYGIKDPEEKPSGSDLIG